MLNRLALAGAALILAITPSLSPAQAPRPAVVANAAPVYIQHWNQLDMSALQFALLSLKPIEIGDERWPAPDALPYEGKALQSLADGIVEAAAIEHCDFGWDRTRGPATLLPHLGNLRASGRLMAVLARRQIDAGNPDGAIPYLAAGYRVASHAAQDRVNAGSRYAMSIFEAVDAVTTLAMTKTALTDEQRAELLAAMETLNPEDPFYGAAGVRGEAQLFAEWMEGRIATGQNREVVEHIRSSLAGAGRPRIQNDPIIAKTSSLENFDIALAEGWSFLNPIIEHWNDQNTDQLQKAFSNAIRNEIMLPVTPETVRYFYYDWSKGRELYNARLNALRRN